MQKGCVILICFIFFVAKQSIAREFNTDSLWAVWNDKELADTVRLKAIGDIAWNGYLFTRPDSAHYVAQKQYDFAKSKGLKEPMADALKIQGASFYLQGDYDGAIELYTSSLSIFEGMGTSSNKRIAKSGKIGIAAILANIGICYEAQGDYDNAIDYQTRSLVIEEKIGNKQGIATSLNNLGMIYKEQGDHASAIVYYTRSLTILEEIAGSPDKVKAMSAKQGIAAASNNIGRIYREQEDFIRALDYYTRSLTIYKEMGNEQGAAVSLNNIGSIYRVRGDLVGAMDHYIHSLTIREKIGDKKGIATCLGNIGNIHMEQGDHARAIDFFRRSLAIREEIGFKRGITASLVNIGKLYQAQGDSAHLAGNAGLSVDKYTNAIAYSSRALSMAQEVGAAREITNAANALFASYKATGRHKLALEMYELHINTKDSLDSEENHKEVIRQEYKHEFEKAELIAEQKENEKRRMSNEKLERRNNLQHSIVLICLLVIAGLLAVIGRFSIPIRVAEGLIFFSFLIFFEFLLVLADPYIEGWSGGAPGIKLLFNAGIATLIFPLHSFFETKLKGRLVKQ